MRFLPFAVALPFFFVHAHADSIGKAPTWDDEKSLSHPLDGSSKSFAETDASVLKPMGPAGSDSPLPFTSLTNALTFVQRQRGLNGRGLPALFWAPKDEHLKDPLEDLLIHEGVGLYDTSLAILVAIDSGTLDIARQMLTPYVDGRYGDTSSTPMELQAIPSVNNGDAFTPFDETAYYYFDFTNVYGDWTRWGNDWKFWTVHTGPNAWLANAALHYVLALRRRGASAQDQAPYLALAEKIAAGMQRLQDAKAGGGIRYGPRGQWHADETSDPYFEINSENNVSAYAVFRLLTEVTGKSTYKESATRILQWLASGDVWDLSGKHHDGLMDPGTGTLAMGATFVKGRWVLQPEHPTDSGGTWTLSALGAAQIDALWGRKAAYHMWQSLRARAGRSAQFGAVTSTTPLAGLDFMDGFPVSESLISPEWSGGGLFALRELMAYYGAGRGVLTEGELSSLQTDFDSMRAFIAKNPNPYASGPGQHTQRQGATGFHWSSPPEDVHALASVYFTLASTQQPDPLGDWRDLHILKIK